MILPWKIKTSEPVADCRVFKVRKDVAISPRTGKAHEMYVLESHDFVNIVPLTPNNEVVLVEQFRHGSKEIGWETPGGLVDGTGESFLECARRELLEETGFAADQLIPIGTVRPNPAIQQNRMYYVLAKNCRKIGEPKPDDAEHIAVHLVPLQEIPLLIESGKIHHALVVAAFYFLDRYLKRI
jgi:8-oxo-dGTP pyrophosphatase MutT (NUDIX family)